MLYLSASQKIYCATRYITPKDELQCVPTTHVSTSSLVRIVLELIFNWKFACRAFVLFVLVFFTMICGHFGFLLIHYNECSIYVPIVVLLIVNSKYFIIKSSPRNRTARLGRNAFARSPKPSSVIQRLAHSYLRVEDPCASGASPESCQAATDWRVCYRRRIFRGRDLQA